MPKNKNQNVQPAKCQRSSSKQSVRHSQPRLSLNPTPPKFSTKVSSRHFLSNPNSLEKKKPTSLEKKRPKALAKKGVKLRKKVEQPTQETIASTTQGRWKEHLKLTFRSKKSSEQGTIHNSSLKCMEQMKISSSRRPAQSFTAILNTFPQYSEHNHMLNIKDRILLMDWLNYVCAELLCRRNTFHMASTFLDYYLHRQMRNPQLPLIRLQALAAGALLLAVKQEQRGTQTYVLNVLISSGTGLSKEEVLGSESAILLGLQFKLNYSTLSFWCDYFSQKWDQYISRDSRRIRNRNRIIMLRDPQGSTYRHYRQMMELSDALVINPLKTSVPPAQLALSIIYLITRIESQSLTTGQEIGKVFYAFQAGFTQKATPIFNDPYNFNSLFNQFLVDSCDFDLSQIISPIKQVGAYLGLPFNSEVDNRACEEASNYQEFLRFATYSPQLRLHLEELLSVM